jgi:hypothetical protein
MIFFLVWTLIAIELCYMQPEPQTWSRHVIDNGQSGADGVRLADINRDGLPDITTGWEEEGITKVYLHPGYEDVTSRWPSVVAGPASSVEDAVFADLDGDGNMDVISSTEGENSKMLVHWGPSQDILDPSNWQTDTIAASDGLTRWMFAVPLDLDESGRPDSVVGWFHSTADPRSLQHWAWHPISNATWIMSLIAHDVNQDGHLDMVLSDRKPGSSNGVRWLQNPGAKHLVESTWDSHFIGAQGEEVMFMDMADLDKDGLVDAIACERTHQRIIFFKKGDTTGLSWEAYAIPIPEITGFAKAVKVADINMDGHQDIVFSANTMGDNTKTGVYWLSYQHSPKDENWNWHPVSGTEGYKFDRLELVDLDGDGDLDILTCEENYGPDSKGLGVIWYENPFLK